MDRAAILDAMAKKAEELYNADPGYHQGGKRGYLTVDIKNGGHEGQWDSSGRPFGRIITEPSSEGEIIFNNGESYEATIRGKVAYTRRTGKSSGANYWEVRGAESWWKGAVISKDGKCICGFSGLHGYDDVKIAEAGIELYEKLK
jgi:hypothetical protein